MNKIINKILSFFRDENEELEAMRKELEEMREELRLVTAECTTLVNGIDFYAKLADCADSREALIKFTEEKQNYARLYLQHVDELKEELESLKRTMRISAVGR